MRTVLALALAVLGPAACGTEDHAAEPGRRPEVVVSTNILGDVVQHLVGDDGRVQVLMPVGADPHDFAPSARQAQTVREADLLVVNGLGLEAGLVDTIEAAAADGVVVIAATDVLEPGSADPHLFTDPVLMADAAELIARRLAAELPVLDTPAFRERVDAYLADLSALHQEVRALLAPIPPARRLLVTNHEVFGYFAARYGFEVLGAVVPGGSTLAEPSAADLADLAALIVAKDVPAVFADTSSSSRVVEALAAEGSSVEVVELYTESLGAPGTDGDTYLGMVRTNAERIAAALG